MTLTWLEFMVCTTAIVLSGRKLSRYGDVIAEKTGIGRIWIGVVLMATVTSLPELVTGISSVTYTQAPNIAVGDVLGSCVFNMLILALLDALYKPMPIYTHGISFNNKASATPGSPHVLDTGTVSAIFR